MGAQILSSGGSTRSLGSRSSRPPHINAAPNTQVRGKMYNTVQSSSMSPSLRAAWHGEPVTEVDTDLGRVTLWWDTGAAVSMLSKRFVATTPLAQSEASLTSKQLGLGGVDLGPFEFEVADLGLPPGFEGGIGYNFFARHIVCMDFPRKRLLIQR